jgi:PKD domain
LNHLRFYFSFRRLTLAVATVVVCAIGVGVLTGAGGVSSTAGYPYYPPDPGDPYCLYEDNNPPHADFTYSPAVPKPGEVVTFTSTSTDPDGDALLTGWDFTGDWDPFVNLLGGIDQSPGPVAQFTYQSPGDYRVRMGVGDRPGLLGDPCFLFDIVDKTVRVEAAGGPPGGGGGGGGPPADKTGPTIVIPGVNKTRRVSRKGVFTFILGPFLESVQGTIAFESVAAVLAQKRGKKKLKLTPKSFSVAKGMRVVIRTKLPKKARQALRRRKRMRMRAKVVARDSIGNPSTRTFPFTLKAPKKTKR